MNIFKTRLLLSRYFCNLFNQLYEFIQLNFTCPLKLKDFGLTILSLYIAFVPSSNYKLVSMQFCIKFQGLRRRESFALWKIASWEHQFACLQSVSCKNEINNESTRGISIKLIHNKRENKQASTSECKMHTTRKFGSIKCCQKLGKMEERTLQVAKTWATTKEWNSSCWGNINWAPTMRAGNKKSTTINSIMLIQAKQNAAKVRKAFWASLSLPSPSQRPRKH